MLPLLALAGVGAATGVGKYFIQKGQADRQRKLQAETTRYSPWTGMQAESPDEPNIVGDIMQGSMAGAQLGQSIMGGQAQQALATRQMASEDARAKLMNAMAGSAGGQGGGGSTWSQMPWEYTQPQPAWSPRY